MPKGRFLIDMQSTIKALQKVEEKQSKYKTDKAIVKDIQNALGLINVAEVEKK